MRIGFYFAGYPLLSTVRFCQCPEIAAYLQGAAADQENTIEQTNETRTYRSASRSMNKSLYFKVSTTRQILVLGITIIAMVQFDGMHRGYVPCGVTAHGSPSGPLQFDRLEAALAARFY